MHNLSTISDDKVEFFYFTCRRDYDQLFPSIRMVRHHFPYARIILAVDCYDFFTLSQHQSFYSEFVNITIEGTTFPRRGNLKGGECLKGMWRFIAENKSTDIEAVIKIDSDVLLLQRDWIDDFVIDNIGMKMVGATSPDTPYYPQGTAYGVTPYMAELLAEDTQRFPAWFDCWEDYEVGYRVARIAQHEMKARPETSILRYRHQKDWIACPPLDFHNEQIANELAKVKVYSVDYLTAQQKPADIPSAKASYMNLFVEWWMKEHNNIGEQAND